MRDASPRFRAATFSHRSIRTRVNESPVAVASVRAARRHPQKAQCGRQCLCAQSLSTTPRRAVPGAARWRHEVPYRVQGRRKLPTAGANPASTGGRQPMTMLDHGGCPRGAGGHHAVALAHGESVTHSECRRPHRQTPAAGTRAGVVVSR